MMNKDEKVIARKIVECCHNKYFCAFEFILWDCNDNSELFYFYLQKIKSEGYDIKEIYSFDELFSDSWRNVIMNFIEVYFSQILPQLSLSLFLADLEIIKRDEIRKRNLKIK